MNSQILALLYYAYTHEQGTMYTLLWTMNL